jgi:outer membrane protein TolC
MNRFAFVLAGPRHCSAQPRPSLRDRSAHRAGTMALGAVSLLTLAAAGAAVAAEPPLTLAEAQRLATLRSKQLEASDLALTASKDLTIGAAERPDPIAKVGLENLPINGPERFSVQRDFMTMRSVGIMQEITRPTKLRARAAESEQAVRLAEAQKAQSLVAVQRDSALAWLDRYYAEALEQTVLQQVQVARLDVTAAEAGYRGGHGTAADVLAARAALAEAEDLDADASREVRGAKLALARWIGEAAESPLAGQPAIDTIPLHKHTLGAQLAEHPEILALQRREELARAAAEVARADRHPDWSVEFMYSQRGIAYSNMVTLELTVPLEIRRAYRQNPKLAAKLAEASQAKAEREDMLLAHAAEISAMIDSWDSARERRERYRSAIVPLAADRSVAARAAYRGGKASLSDLLLAQRAEIDARLKALHLEQSAAHLWAQLTFLNSTPAVADVATPSVDSDRGALP